MTLRMFVGKFPVYAGRVMGKVEWRAAVAAGMAAGILATDVQVALWFILTDALPEIFYRDARLAAAIVMGPGALSPAGARAPVLLVAQK